MSRPTVQRITEAAGAAYVVLQKAEVERIERELPAPPAGPAKQFLSADGAMVPLVGGEWAEVKTLVIGEVQPPTWSSGEMVVQTTDALSYFSRLAEAETFQRLALVETQRRGVETAGRWRRSVMGRNGAEVRRSPPCGCGAHPGLSACRGASDGVGQAAFGETSRAVRKQWLAQQLHDLKHHGPQAVLTEVRRLVAAASRAAGHRWCIWPTWRSGWSTCTTRPIRPRAADRRWRRGKWQQAGGGGPPQGQRHALGPRACQPYAGLAQRRLQRPLGRGLAADQPALRQQERQRRLARQPNGAR